ncbi:MAG: quinolinate synthase NadA [Acidobacteria bacterium]|nr:MAG: quinolinate synthase NadA [Acidobacteriota bacterium]
MSQTCILPQSYFGTDRAQMESRIAAAKSRLGKRLVILGHHYQRDDVVKYADFTGDSFKLSQQAASRPDADYIIFCGVHFMAESADVLSAPHQRVILPDLAAGCSMADMAEIDQLEQAWSELEEVFDGTPPIIPITYMNSSAAIKAFCGERGGAVCTSSNAQAVFNWASARQEKILFLPDQHLGRNTGYSMGIPLDSMPVWDPYRHMGGNTAEAVIAAKVLLWKGHCSVHQRFTPEMVDQVRSKHPGIQVIVHPECTWEVVQKSDATGSTEKIIQVVRDASAGTSWAVGTELHLVNRLAEESAREGKLVISLEERGCLCSTMFRISPAHLLASLENLVEGRIVNQITVPEETAHWTRVALDRMLAIC